LTPFTLLEIFAASLMNILPSLTILHLDYSKACYYHIRQLRCIRPYLVSSTACSIATSIVTHSFVITFCWQPSHVGIPGNEKANKAAKSALNKPILRIPIPYTDLKPIINKYIRYKWQQIWKSQTQNKLFVACCFDIVAGVDGV